MPLASQQNPDKDKLSHTAHRMLDLRPTVFTEWERKVLDSVVEACTLQHPILINTFPAFYVNLAEAISPDHPRRTATESSTIASEHGGERARLTNYNPAAVVHEYHLLQQTIFEVLEYNGVPLNEDEVSVIHLSINTAIRESIAAFALVLSGLREQFFAALTHDLRNPLNTASIATQLIVRNTDSPTIKDLASKVMENLERIDQMTESLLDSLAFDNAQRSRLDLSEFDMLAVVQEVREQATIVFGDRVEVIGEPAMGYWSRDAMKRVIENLINNAAKYGQAESPIRVHIKTENQRLVLTVHNEGDPIPEADLESIFKIFERSHSSRKGLQEGWGVGLPYVRSVAERHGGSIVVESNAERGTTFIVDLPLDSRQFQNAPVLM